MTDEQINIAIAEHCGFNLEEYRMEEGGINVAAIPDYCNDLNDMHDAEKELYANECSMYFRILSKVHPTFGILPKWMDIDHEEEQAWEYFQLIHTTARQRAEAFLKTIGKWEE
jgi:hypothetical protein